MPVPTNITPETATAITSLPYSLTVTAADLTLLSAGTGYISTCDTTQYRALWWAIHTNSTDNYLAIAAAPSASANYSPQVNVWTGTPPTLVQYEVGTQEFCDYANYFNVPVSPSTTYYIQVTDSNNTEPLGADLDFNVQRAPNEPIPARSILINDDTDDFPALVLSSITGDVLRVVDFPAGEAGATLPTGEICVPRAATHATLKKQTAVYSADLTLIASHNWAPCESIAGICSNNNDMFYVAVNDTGGLTRSYHEVDALGVPTGRSWDLGALYQQFTVDTASTILYYGLLQSAGPVVSTIYRWDLATDMAMSDLVADIPGWRLVGSQQPDAFTGVDDSVFFMFSLETVSQPIEIRRYSSVGGLLNTYGPYPVGGSIGNLCDLNRIGPCDDTSFMIWGSEGTALFTSAERSLFQRIQISDGTILDAPPVVSTQGTSGGGGIEGVAFSISNCCPLIVIRVADTTLAVECPPDALAYLGTAYSSFATATGGTPPYTFTISAGALPDGLVLDAATGEVSGTPILVDYFPFTITVTDDVGGTDDADCAITISEATTYPICRKIRFPLPFNQNLLMFLQRLEFLIQSGVSSNASITINLSRDGGYTWPITRTLTAGAMGAYDWRVYSTNFGQGRNWVCEFITDEPAFWALIQCYADMEQGTS